MKKVLYIGGFELPDKNAAAQRVVGNAKVLKDLGYEVVFVNALKNESETAVKNYFGFKCIEYKRENEFTYIITGKKAISIIEKENPSIVIAYNYPSIALSRICKYTKKRGIKCVADVTEWYPAWGNFLQRAIISMDTFYRMRCVHKKLDGLIVISRYLYNYYCGKSSDTVLIPPLIDITDAKWNITPTHHKGTVFIYAGEAASSKERLDLIVQAVTDSVCKDQIKLEIIGMTKAEFEKMYGMTVCSDNIVFYGRLPHNESLKHVQNADWAIIMRDRNRSVEAGFPTKLVETISAGTPAIVNDFSNILEYLSEEECIVTNLQDLKGAITQACATKKNPRRDIFDYRNYVKQFEEFMNNLQK